MAIMHMFEEENFDRLIYRRSIKGERLVRKTNQSSN